MNPGKKFAFGIAAIALATSALADWPDRPIRMVIGFAPGGGTTGRLLGGGFDPAFRRQLVASGGGHGGSDWFEHPA